MLVDDAVIYLENILRRLRMNASLASPKARLIVIRDASLEISGAVVCNGVILLVLLPVFLMPGVRESSWRLWRRPCTVGGGITARGAHRHPGARGLAAARP